MVFIRFLISSVGVLIGQHYHNADWTITNPIRFLVYLHINVFHYKKLRHKMSFLFSWMLGLISFCSRALWFIIAHKYLNPFTCFILVCLFITISILVWDLISKYSHFCSPQILHTHCIIFLLSTRGEVGFWQIPASHQEESENIAVIYSYVNNFINFRWWFYLFFYNILAGIV